MNTTVLEIQCESVKEQGFIARYNQVINAYNKYGEESDPKMEVMVGNPFIYKISVYLNKPLAVFGIIFAILLVPLVNVFFLGCIYIYLFYLRQQNKKHLRNLSRVADPFENFYFMPDYCEQMNKHFVLLKFQLGCNCDMMQKSKGLLLIRSLEKSCPKNLGRRDR